MAFGRLGSIGAGFGRLGASSGGVAAPAGGALLLTNETDGFATDFTYAVDAQRVAVKAASAVSSYALDSFYTNSGTSAKQVFNVSGALVWSPHNMFLNSAAPATQSVTTVVGQNYTVTVTGSGSMTGSAGASGVATAGAPLTYTATTATSTFTKAGSPTTIQMNRGAVATAYLATTGSIRNGLAIDYDPVTHAVKGLLVEPQATNLLLNSTTLSTQSVTVSAVAYTLSFLGTGTITLTGVSTAGPLVGTGASNRVSLTFTPTAGSLTCTVSGTVSNAQLETGTVASSPIPSFAAAATRTVDGYSATSFGGSATAGTMVVSVFAKDLTNIRGVGSVSDNSVNNRADIRLVNNPSIHGVVTSATTGVASFTATSPFVAAARNKAAIAYAANNFAWCGNGGTVETDVAGAAPASITHIIPGNLDGMAGALNAWVETIVYVPRRMSNAEMQAATT